MPWLALSYGVLGMSSSVYTAFDTIGQPVYSARLQLVRLAAMVIVVFPVAQYFRNLEIVAATRLLVTIAITPTLFGALMKPFDLSLGDYVTTLWRPMVSSAVMAIAIYAVNSMLEFAGNPRLLIDIAVGVISYTGAAMALWFVCGQPNGPESELWRRMRPSLGFS
jgi:hypothetical protein